MGKRIPMVIYCCRRCGMKFETEGKLVSMRTDKDSEIDIPTDSIWRYHKCDDGVFGIGDLIGGHVKEGG